MTLTKLAREKRKAIGQETPSSHESIVPGTLISFIPFWLEHSATAVGYSIFYRSLYINHFNMIETAKKLNRNSCFYLNGEGGERKINFFCVNRNHRQEKD